MSSSAPGSISGTGGSNNGNIDDSGKPRRLDDVRIRAEGRVWYERWRWGEVVFAHLQPNHDSGDVIHKWRLFYEKGAALTKLDPAHARQQIEQFFIALTLNKVPNIKAIHSRLTGAFSETVKSAGRVETVDDTTINIILFDGKKVPVNIAHWPDTKHNQSPDEIAEAITLLPIGFFYILERVELLHSYHGRASMSFHRSKESAVGGLPRGFIRIFKAPQTLNLYPKLIHECSHGFLDAGFAAHHMLWVLAKYADGTNPARKHGLENPNDGIAVDAEAMVTVSDAQAGSVNVDWIVGNPTLALLYLGLLSHPLTLPYDPERILESLNVIDEIDVNTMLP